MPNYLQDFLASATRKAVADLETALLRLPEDKRNWAPAESSRSALDQVGEVALISDNAADLIRTKVWPENYDFAEFEQRKKQLMSDWPAMKAMLDKNTEKVVAAIAEVPDEDLSQTVQMPWGPMTVAQIMAYAYWNASYHEGQINYIASILGCLPNTM